jgi:hypothetical protein
MVCLLFILVTGRFDKQVRQLRFFGPVLFGFILRQALHRPIPDRALQVKVTALPRVCPPGRLRLGRRSLPGCFRFPRETGQW